MYECVVSCVIYVPLRVDFPGECFGAFLTGRVHPSGTPSCPLPVTLGRGAICFLPEVLYPGTTITTLSAHSRHQTRRTPSTE